MGKGVDREGPIQEAIVAYLRRVLPPECIVHHCRNEINKRGANIARELAKAAKRGAVAGFPDIIVMPYATSGAFFLEVKAEGSYARPNQKEVHARMKALGYHVAVVRSIDDTRDCLVEFGIGFNEKLHVKGAEA